MKEHIEPYTPPKKSEGIVRKIFSLVGLADFIEAKAQEYYALKKANHWKHFQAGLILDLGCGFGQYMKHAPANIQVIGINLNNEEIAEAHRQGLRVIKADCRKLPMSKNKVDGVNCSHLIEHIEDPTEVLKEAHRVLRPGGAIVIRTPDIVRHFEHFYDDTSHINPFTKKKVEKILVYSGFRNIRVTYGDCTLNWLKPLTIFPKLRVAIENAFSPWLSHELVGIANK